jgi:hypothetical protein
MTHEKILEDILFNLIVLASDVPVDDYEKSIAEIGALSGFKDEVFTHFLLAGGEYMKANKFESFSKLYAEFLMANGKQELALELNNKAAL